MGIVQMGAPKELILNLKEHFQLDTFVETGTFEGKTTAWAAQHFRKVYTIEGAEVLYRAVVEKFGQPKANIQFIYGDTRQQLRGLIPQLQTPVLFWLDAHYSGGPTFGEEDQCPLLEELEIINQSSVNHFVLIDDARLFCSPPPTGHVAEQWPDITQVIDSLKARFKDNHIVIMNDVIISVPLQAKDILVKYCQAENLRAWEELSSNRRRQQGVKQNSGLTLIKQGLSLLVKGS